MSKIFQLEGGQYEHPNEYKLVSTVRGTTILQPEFGTVIIEGDVIEASTHNTIQKNGVLASKVNVTMESTDTVLVPTDMTIESDLFNELKIMLLFETGTTLPSNSFIKLKETNVPIANVNDYVVNANTPLLFLYFDSKFYAYKAGSGTESLGDLSDVTLTSPTNGQALVYNGSKFVNKTVEAPAGNIKISSTAQVKAGTDDTTAVSPYKLKELYTAGSKKTQNGYQKLPSGVILQWGMVADSPEGTNVTFPVAFPTVCASLQITRGGGTVEESTGSYDSGASAIMSLSNVGFSLDSVIQSGDKSLVYFLGIGY